MIDEGFGASTISEHLVNTFRDTKEGMDADVPVDAQNASTATWKLQTVFHKRPHPSSFLEEETRTQERPATKPNCYPCPWTNLSLMSPAAQVVSVKWWKSQRVIIRHPDVTYAAFVTSFIS